MILMMPESLDDLWQVWHQYPDARLMAGGTDLLVQLRTGRIDSSDLICLERIKGFSGIEETDQRIRIGAGTCLSKLLETPLIRDRLGVLHQACDSLGSPLIRNMATIGGNICTASPAGDTLPALYVLDAALELVPRAAAGPSRSVISFKVPGGPACKSGLLWALVIPVLRIWHHIEKVGQLTGPWPLPLPVWPLW